MMFPENVSVAAINQMSEGNMLEHLGIEFTNITSEALTARMPVDHRTRQPMGLLHGGASVVLAESMGSVASYLCVDSEKTCLRRTRNQRQSYQKCPRRLCVRNGTIVAPGQTNPRMGNSCYQ